MDDGRIDLLEAGWKEESFGFWQLAAMVRRQLALVLGVVLAACVLSGAYIVISQPLYTATASLFADVGGAESTDASASFALDNHVELVQSDRTALAVIEELDLGSVFAPEPGIIRRTVTDVRNWLGLSEADAPEEDDRDAALIRAVRGRLDVRRVGNTTIIEISYTSPLRSLSVAIANSFASNYVRQLSAQAAATTERRIRRLEDRAEEVKRRALIANSTVQELHAGGTFLVTGAEDLQRRVGELRQRLTVEVADEAALRAKLALLGDPPDGQPVSSAGLQAPEALALHANFLSASASLSDLERQPGVPAATVEQMRAVVSELRGSLAEAVRRAREVLEVDLAAAMARQASLRAEIDAIREYGQDAAWSRYLEAQREATFYEDIYRGYLGDLEQTYRQTRTAPVRVISEALSPSTPSWPRYRVVLSIALTAGIFVALGLALLRAWARRSAAAGPA